MRTVLGAVLAAMIWTGVWTGYAMAQDDMPANAEDLVWARPDGLELGARIYWPEALGSGPLPVVIDVHGGAWSALDRTSGEYYAAALAGRGYIVVSIDFRQGPDFQHPAGSADVAAAVRWVRLNAARLEADPQRIALIGSSSGGHLAMLAALRPDAPAHAGTPIRDMDGPADAFAPQDSIDASVAAVVAMWPVSDPLARFKYAQRAGVEPLLGGHQAYFGGDEAAMLDASIPRIVTSGEAGAGADLPPLLVIQPGMDSNIPQDMTFDLLRAYQSREGHLEYGFYPGQPHAFGHRPSAEADDMIALVADFLDRRFAD